MKTYLSHAKANLRVTARCVELALWHFAHAIIPVAYTSHDWWGRYKRHDDERPV